MFKTEKFEDAVEELLTEVAPSDVRQLELLSIGVSEIIRAQANKQFTSMIESGQALTNPLEVSRTFAQEHGGYNRARVLGNLLDKVIPLDDSLRWVDRMDVIAQTDIDPLTGDHFELTALSAER